MLLLLSGNIWKWVIQVNAVSDYVLLTFYSSKVLRVWKSPSATAKILTQLKSAWCIWEIQLNDMQTRDALNCKWEKCWAHSQQIILIENFYLCTGVQRQNIKSGFIFFCWIKAANYSFSTQYIYLTESSAELVIFKVMKFMHSFISSDTFFTGRVLMHKIEALVEAQAVTGRPLLAEVFVSQKMISIKIMIVLLILMNVLCTKKIF